MSPTPRPPPPDFNVAGWTPTGALRIRMLAFGFAIVEEQRLYRDGTRVWVRAQSGEIVSLREARPE